MLQTDPSAPDYDPTKFLGILRANEVYRQEPRTDEWATPMEGWLTEKVSSELSAIPGSPRIHVECKTTMCKFSWESSDEASPKVSRLLRFLYGGEGGGPGGNNKEWVVMYKGGRHTDAFNGGSSALIGFVHERRNRQLSAALSRLRKGNNILRELYAGEIPKK